MISGRLCYLCEEVIARIEDSHSMEFDLVGMQGLISQMRDECTRLDQLPPMEWKLVGQHPLVTVRHHDGAVEVAYRHLEDFSSTVLSAMSSWL